MTKKKLKLKQILLFVVVIVGVIFLLKNTVGYLKGVFGNVSEQQAAEFLSGFGWELDIESCVKEEIVIPKEFSEVYERYNALQIRQGYDLSLYKADTVIRYTFEVKNFGSYEMASAHVLVKGGKIIGGDVCSNDLNGVMVGFDGKE